MTHNRYVKKPHIFFNLRVFDDEMDGSGVKARRCCGFAEIREHNQFRVTRLHLETKIHSLTQTNLLWKFSNGFAVSLILVHVHAVCKVANPIQKWKTKWYRTIRHRHYLYSNMCQKCTSIRKSCLILINNFRLFEWFWVLFRKQLTKQWLLPSCINCFSMHALLAFDKQNIFQSF